MKAHILVRTKYRDEVLVISDIWSVNECVFDCYKEASESIQKIMAAMDANSGEDFEYNKKRISSEVEAKRYEDATRIWNRWNRSYRTDGVRMYYEVHGWNVGAMSEEAKDFKRKSVPHPDGMTCKCGFHNTYVTEATELDGSYICKTCKARTKAWSNEPMREAA